MSISITVLPGDGIGPEVIAEAVKVLDAVAIRHDLEFEFQYEDIGGVAIHKTGLALPLATLESCKRTSVVLLGAIGDPAFDHSSAVERPEKGLLDLRRELGLFANIRPVIARPSLADRAPLKAELLKDVDMVIYRELTGGSYFGTKNRSEDGETAFDGCSYSRTEINRIAVKAFEAARSRRKSLTLVDKANVLETSRLWRETVKELASEYPDVEVDYLYVDHAAMELIRNPGRFDVLLTENLFGDILSDEASVLAGSIGLLPSGSVGSECAMFEPIHGSFPQAAKKNIANPCATILSAAMMLEHLNLTEAARSISEAVEWALDNGVVTAELSDANCCSCSEVGDLIAYKITDSDLQINAADLRLRNQTII